MKITICEDFYFSAPKKSSTGKYTEYLTVKYKGFEYGIHRNDPNTLNKSWDFKCQISKISRYDNAEYIWAIFENCKFRFIEDGREIDSMVMSPYEDNEDLYADMNSWAEDVMATGIKELVDFNKAIKPIPSHN